MRMKLQTVDRALLKKNEKDSVESEDGRTWLVLEAGGWETSVVRCRPGMQVKEGFAREK